MTIATSKRVYAESLTDQQQMAGLTSEAEELAWKGLFKVGGIAALIAGLIFRRNLGAELTLLKGSGLINAGPAAPPTTVLDWFTLLRDNPLLGLTWLNLFDMVNYALVGLMFLALFIVLRRASQSAMAIAAVQGFAGVVIYLASNQALTMLSLSGQYAVATTDMQRSLLLAAGQATLAIHANAGYEGAGLYLSFFGVTVAGLISSMVMLRSKRFGKATAYTGILANGFGLSYYLALVFAPALVALPISIS
ncbi:MAG TPA: hypothetical protein VLG46_02060, partial [Anaerolineae bacterium]|nr:hypothetical protein [Anaerolineae bacterium]